MQNDINLSASLKDIHKSVKNRDRTYMAFDKIFAKKINLKLFEDNP